MSLQPQAKERHVLPTPVPLYEALAYDIGQLGIDTCFGLMSDDTIGLVATLDSIGLRFCGARHETNAVLAASGYAAATGKIGIAIVGRGPAAANAMHGIMVASRGSAPVLVIMGEAEDQSLWKKIGPDYKEYNAIGAVSVNGIQAFRIDSASTARQTFADATQAALRGATVTLHIPGSVQDALVPNPTHDFEARRPGALVEPPAPALARHAAVKAACDLISGSRKPIILAGHGAHRAGAREAIEALADKIGALLITSLKGKDLFRGHSFNLGLCGSFSHSVARKFIDQADCLIVFGAGLNLYTTSMGHGFPDIPVIHVDDTRERIGQWYTVDVAIVADAKAAAIQLAENLPMRDAASMPFRSGSVRDEIAGFDILSDFIPANTNRTLDTRILAHNLNRLLPEKRNIVLDGGNFMMVASYLAVQGPAHFKLSTDFVSIGAGLGTAMGFASGRPDEITVLMIGDGGLMMSLSELETVARQGLPMIVVVVNDCAYGAELQICRQKNLPEAMAVFPDIDFAPIAEALGFEAATIRTLADLENCRDLLVNCSGPVLLDCKVNADVAAPFIAEYVSK